MTFDPARTMYRILLRLLPRAFRNKHGSEMEEMLLAALRQEVWHRPGGRFAVWMRAGWDIARRAPVEHRRQLLESLRRRRTAPSGSPARTTWRPVQSLLQDARFAIRTLCRNPGFTAAALLTLTIGIGANTAIFSVVNGVLLRPLPYPEPDRLFGIIRFYPDRSATNTVVSRLDFIDWNEQTHLFAGMAAWMERTSTLTGRGDPERIAVAIVSHEFLSVLGVQPILGRPFHEAEDGAGAGRVAVLSHPLWVQGFAANPDIIGESITLSGQSYNVIGVAPASFRDPLVPGVQLWEAGFHIRSRCTARDCLDTRVIARLERGASVQQATMEINLIAENLEAQYPSHNKGVRVALVPLRDRIVGDMRVKLIMLLGAVSFVLLMTCANVANLLLAKAAARDTEIAVRTALGASRGRLVRQLLTEAALLGLAGGILGLILATLGVVALKALAPGGLPRLAEISVDRAVLAYAGVASLITGLVFGAVPALHLTGARPGTALKDGGRTAHTSTHRALTRDLLAVVQIAISLVLLIGSGLLAKSFARLMRVDLGFDPTNVLTARVSVEGSHYDDFARRIDFFESLLAETNARPEVQSAGAILFHPIQQHDNIWAFELEGAAPSADGVKNYASVRAVTPTYFRTIDIPLLRGRDFSERDHDAGPLFVIINESMARTFWPGDDPVGKRIRIRSFPNNHLVREVVGVAGDVKVQGLDDRNRHVVYMPYRQFPVSSLDLVVRTSSEPGLFARTLREMVNTLDPTLAVYQVSTMEDTITRSVADPRFYMLLLTCFAAISMTLAAVGIYGVLSYSVAERNTEMGIRIALGARSREILALVLQRALVLTTIGVGLGLGGAWVLTRFLSSQLYQVQPTDPPVFFGVAAFLASIALLATYVPAARATRVDPMATLRYE